MCFVKWQKVEPGVGIGLLVQSSGSLFSTSRESDMKTIILAGGLGTRLSEETQLKPKPMVEIGGKPILWHIMKIYGSQGFNEFYTALGYKSEVIKDFFINYYHRQNHLRIETSSGHIEVEERADSTNEDWVVNLIETGNLTNTGGRIRRMKPWVDDGTFMMTYGDGVADVDINALLKFHKSHGRLATVTAVRPPARFGGISFSDGLVKEFIEKPQIGEGWINGGFFVLEPGVIDYISGDETSFEKESLEKLALDNQLAAYKHEGFWQCMDTIRDVALVNELWENGTPPWKKW
jgi:glucose-1-phosphate cytidylyltransferase